VASVFEELELGDPRRAERVVETVRKMARQPQATLPEAMGSDAALEGAYRLMNSERVPFDALNQAHSAATAQRARQARRVLVIHDTTTFAFPHADPDEVGYLNTGKAGFLGHYSLVVAFDGSRRPLGIGHLEPIIRTKKPSAARVGGAKSRKQSGSETARKQDRESLRWSRGFTTTSQLLEGCEVIHLADREGDNYELLGQAIQQRQRFIIRVRVPERRVEGEEGTAVTLMSALQSCRGMLRREVFLATRAPKPTAKWSKAHPPRGSRTADLEFSATKVVLPRPRYQSKELPVSLELNVVRVFEPAPPPNTEPVEWLLYTTEPIATADDVARIVDAYRCRWLIEECNKALKTGCRYEQRQFEGRQALLTLLALTLPIACELLWLRACSREQPDRPATDVLTAVQLQILNTLGSRKLPSRPTVHDALWAVAALGGHIKNNGEPGWLVLHRGMVKLTAYEQGWLAALSSVELLSISR
jgi:transposase-like protein/DDE family transposase